ncbi:65_t:CDS:2 [Acaulospora colombiana]|uniref:65_t:CDS:1 n=1 Tax=Acaulospora colombiana TaxID=27376 RepID=A0ACA9K640_9GLOM|nr:65_t:CDS:2 [Acaulospora colombiana]
MYESPIVRKFHYTNDEYSGENYFPFSEAREAITPANRHELDGVNNHLIPRFPIKRPTQQYTYTCKGVWKAGPILTDSIGRARAPLEIMGRSHAAERATISIQSLASPI